MVNEKVVDTTKTHEIVKNLDTGVTRKRKLFKDVDIVNEGRKIILPEGMETGQAITWLRKKLEQEEEEMAPNIPISCYPFDGLVAFQKAIKQVFGYATYKPIPGFFGPTPPQFISVPIGPHEDVECPIGKIQIPGISGYILLNAGTHNKKPCLKIGGKIKNKDFAKIKELAEATKAIVKKESIYQGKAIRLGQRRDERGLNEFGDQESAHDSIHNHAPTFIKVDGIDEDNLVLPNTIEQQVKSLLWTPIEKTKVCRSTGVPLKRGVLLSGAYGTGKSLTGTITMKKAVDNGWTFINLADPDMLAVAIEMAAWYQPAVIFCEDIDQVIGTKERNADVNAILNVVDGIEKNKEIIVVVTTNHVEKINVAMIRPGRLDAIITFMPPDPEAAGRLLRLYAVTESGHSLISDDEDITAAAETMAGAPASMVREVVERAKLSAIARSGKADSINGKDLQIAADNIQDHLQLMQGVVEEHPIHPAIVAAGKSFGVGMANGMSDESFLKRVRKEVVSRLVPEEAAKG